MIDDLDDKVDFARDEIAKVRETTAREERRIREGQFNQRVSWGKNYDYEPDWHDHGNT